MESLRDGIPYSAVGQGPYGAYLKSYLPQILRGIGPSDYESAMSLLPETDNRICRFMGAGLAMKANVIAPRWHAEVTFAFTLVNYIL